MKPKLVLFLLVFLLIVNHSISQIDSNKTIIVPSLKDSLSSKNDSITNKIDNLRVPLNEYTYGNRPRYTLTGYSPYNETQINNTNLAVFGGIFGAFFVGQHIWQEETIWKDKVKFRILEDAMYSIYLDKFGHFYGGYIMSYAFNEILLGIGFGKEDGLLWGSILGMAYQSYIEVLDGYGADFGFSPSDFYADIVGASFYYAQQKIPFLQNFTPKFHYYPAEWHGEHSRKPHDMFIDDYSSQTFYFSVNVHNLLPNKYAKYWPDWLELTFGYAARNLSVNDASKGISPYPNSYKYSEKYGDINVEAWGNPKFLVGLDYDLVKLLPDGGNAWNWFKQTLNYVKLPSPVIEFSRDKPKFFLIYPFQVKF